LALSTFLGFRNNVAYERFWEGRRLWGNLVNVCRTLAIQTFTLINASSMRRSTVSRSSMVRHAVA
jgi:putative membrane protein